MMMRFNTIGPGLLKGTLQATREDVLTSWATDAEFARSFSDAINAYLEPAEIGP